METTAERAKDNDKEPNLISELSYTGREMKYTDEQVKQMEALLIKPSNIIDKGIL